MTGSTPGIAVQTGHVKVLGCACVESTVGASSPDSRAPAAPSRTDGMRDTGGVPPTAAQPQNIFVFVSSSAWTSKPMTGSNLSEITTDPRVGGANELQPSAVVLPPLQDDSSSIPQQSHV